MARVLIGPGSAAAGCFRVASFTCLVIGRQVGLRRWFLNRGTSPSPHPGNMRQYLDTVWVVTTGGAGATIIQWVQVKDAAELPRMHSTVTLDPRMRNLGLEGPRLGPFGSVCHGLSSLSRLGQAFSQGSGHAFPEQQERANPKAPILIKSQCLMFVNIPSNKATHMARVILGGTPNFYSLPTFGFSVL